MMKKKYILLLLVSILFIPFFVYAEEDNTEAIKDETITNEVVLEETTKTEEIKQEPTIEEMEKTEVVEQEPAIEEPTNTEVVEQETTIEETTKTEEAKQEPTTEPAQEELNSSKEVGSISGGDPYEPDVALITGLEAPKIGSHPTYATVVDSDFTILEQNWVNRSDNKIMTANDKFEANKHYGYAYRFKIGTDGKSLSTWAYFSSSEYYMGGGATSGPDGGGGGIIDFFMGKYDENSPQPSTATVTINLPAPTVYGKQQKAQTSNKYIVKSEEWYNLTDNIKMSASATFQPNKEYKYVVGILSAYYSDQNLFGNLSNSQYYNGFVGGISPGITSEVTAYFYFGNKEDLKIETGDIIIQDINIPRIGAKVVEPTVIVNNEGVLDVYSSWNKRDGNSYLTTYINENEEFTKGIYYYYLSINLRPGYNFKDDFEIINNMANNLNDDYFTFFQGTGNSRAYGSYSATYVLLEDGHSFMVVPNMTDFYVDDYVSGVFTIYPHDVSDLNLYTYSSSDNSVATIEEDGSIHLLSLGNATINVTNSLGETDSFDITVHLKPVAITIEPQTIVIEKGRVYPITIITDPIGAYLGDFGSWSSENYQICNVGRDNNLYAYEAGTSKIYYYYFGYEEPIIAEATVIVKAGVEDIVLEKETIILDIGESEQIQFNIVSDLDYVDYDIFTEDTIVAYTDQSGIVYGISEGETNVFIQSGDIIKSIRVIVNDKLTFKDVKESDWYYDVIKYANHYGFIKGYNENKFGPNDKVTRGQLVTILWRLEGEPNADALPNNFKDVGTDYYTSAVKWANSNDIIHGYNSEKFGPNDPIIRQDLAVILNNYARYLGLVVDGTVNLETFADYNKVSNSYAEPALKWAVTYGVMSGKNLNKKKYISPSDNTTRAETAAMISNFLNSFNIIKDQATNEAKSLLENDPYSRTELVRQLIFYGYTRADAEYAVDNCEANWNEQAVNFVQRSINEEPNSLSGLLEMLLDCDYTYDEAYYGVNNSGVDWNEQAVKYAKGILNEMPCSYNYLFIILNEHILFTEEEATYGVDNCEADWNEQAIRAISFYADDTYSQEDLIAMLESLYFTHEQAQYAVDNI